MELRVDIVAGRSLWLPYSLVWISFVPGDIYSSSFNRRLKFQQSVLRQMNVITDKASLLIINNLHFFVLVHLCERHL